MAEPSPEDAAALVDELVELGDLRLTLRRPRDAEALLSEEAFEHEEFLPYWAELWPSGLSLARLLATRSLTGVRVLELGCGLGLPSLVAAARGATALATDWAPAALELLVENAGRNGLALETAAVRWGEPGALVARGPWELVLAADVLYEQRNGDLLLELLPRVVDERSEILLAEPGRPHAAAFLAAAEAQWTIERLGANPAVYRLAKP